MNCLVVAIGPVLDDVPLFSVFYIPTISIGEIVSFLVNGFARLRQFLDPFGRYELRYHRES